MAQKRKYRHLLGTYMIGEAQKAVELAQRQFDILDKEGELLKGKDMRYVEISVYLVDFTPESPLNNDNKTEGTP